MNRLILLSTLVFICLSCSTNKRQVNKEYILMGDVCEKYIKDTDYFMFIHEHNIPIYFLVDNLTNKNVIRNNSRNPQKLEDGVYHFYIPDLRYSYDHILIKYNGKIKIFENVYCDNTIPNVKEYIYQKKIGNKTIIDINLVQYRDSAKYIKTDNYTSFNCE